MLSISHAKDVWSLRVGQESFGQRVLGAQTMLGTLSKSKEHRCMYVPLLRPCRRDRISNVGLCIDCGASNAGICVDCSDLAVKNRIATKPFPMTCLVPTSSPCSCSRVLPRVCV